MKTDPKSSPSTLQQIARNWKASSLKRAREASKKYDPTSPVGYLRLVSYRFRKVEERKGQIIALIWLNYEVSRRHIDKVLTVIYDVATALFASWMIASF